LGTSSKELMPSSVLAERLKEGMSSLARCHFTAKSCYQELWLYLLFCRPQSSNWSQRAKVNFAEMGSDLQRSPLLKWILIDQFLRISRGLRTLNLNLNEGDWENLTYSPLEICSRSQFINHLHDGEVFTRSYWFWESMGPSPPAVSP